MTPEQVTKLCDAITKIAHGPTSGATGLESVAMSVAGEGLKSPIGPALQDLADNVGRVADALENIQASMP
jgi:hypothetical protein